MAEQNIEELQDKFMALHQAGKTAEAAKVAKELRTAMQEQERSGKVESIDPMGDRSMVDKVASWFKPKDTKNVPTEEAAGSMAGGALSGAAFNVAAPYAMEAIGKLPHPLAKTIGAAGSALKLVPVSERALAGAGAGAGMSVASTIGDMTGAPPALTFGGELALGGVGQMAGTLAQRGASTVLKAGAQAAAGNAGGALRSASTLASPNKTAMEALAERTKTVKFGKALPEFSTKLEKNDSQLLQYTTAREADQKFFAGKPTTRIGKDGQPEAIPPSEQYRDALFDGVRGLLQNQKLFSTSEPFKKFAQFIDSKVESGMMTEGERSQLMKALRSDQVVIPPNKPKSFWYKDKQSNQLPQDVKDMTAENYPNTVDYLRREFGKLSEKGEKTGFAAANQVESENVKRELNRAYDDYLQANGLGRLNQTTQMTYKNEKLAEAKDNFQKLLFGHVSPADAEKYIRNLKQSGENEALAVVKQGLTTHLANTPAKEIFTEFGKVEKMLAQTELAKPSRLIELQRAAKQIQDMAEGKVKDKLMSNWKRAVLLAASGETGQKAGKAMAAEEE